MQDKNMELLKYLMEISIPLIFLGTCLKLFFKLDSVLVTVSLVVIKIAEASVESLTIIWKWISDLLFMKKRKLQSRNRFKKRSHTRSSRSR